jgi:hypothetical protein
LGQPATAVQLQPVTSPVWLPVFYQSSNRTSKHYLNPVDLNNCWSHQAYYTALSRSLSADGTVILQGFDAQKITGKASGALRQEFRDLELLDEITKLQYLSKLPHLQQQSNQ